jgi:hypothetical protein
MVQFASTLPDYSQPVRRQEPRRRSAPREDRVTTLPNYTPTTISHPQPMPAGRRVPRGWTVSDFQQVAPPSKPYHYSQQLHSLGAMSSLEQAGLTAFFVFIAVGGIVMLLASAKKR